MSKLNSTNRLRITSHAGAKTFRKKYKKERVKNYELLRNGSAMSGERREITLKRPREEEEQEGEDEEEEEGEDELEGRVRWNVCPRSGRHTITWDYNQNTLRKGTLTWEQVEEQHQRCQRHHQQQQNQQIRVVTYSKKPHTERTCATCRAGKATKDYIQDFHSSRTTSTSSSSSSSSSSASSASSSLNPSLRREEAGPSSAAPEPEQLSL